MTVTLRDAIGVLEERKKAMGISPPFTHGEEVDLRPLLIGTDLDHDELEEVIAPTIGGGRAPAGRGGSSSRFGTARVLCAHPHTTAT